MNLVQAARVLVPAGTYIIGTNRADCLNPRRKVTLTRGFEMATHPITNADRKAGYREMAGRKETHALMATAHSGRCFVLPGFFGTEADLARKALTIPGDIHVELKRVVPDPDELLGAIPENQRRDLQPAVCWLYDELIAFANAQGGRLPTEAEWEIAARTANDSDKVFDYSTRKGKLMKSAEKMADFGGNAPLDVGSFLANRRDIFDMTGGVWEYLDTIWASEVDLEQTVDPTGPRDGVYRSVRGGSFYDNEMSLLAAYRNDDDLPVYRNFDIGGRLAWRPQGSQV